MGTYGRSPLEHTVDSCNSAFRCGRDNTIVHGIETGLPGSDVILEEDLLTSSL